MPYIVMRLQKSIKTNLGPVSVVDDDHMGFISVFKTKKGARKICGSNVQLYEVMSIEEAK